MKLRWLRNRASSKAALAAPLHGAAAPVQAALPAELEGRSVLRFSGVDHEGAGYDGGVSDVTLRIGASELMVILTQPSRQNLPLADLAEGLTRPAQGWVTFYGEPWRSLSPQDASQRRGRIGRTFAGGAWVSHLGVEENILLRQMHHTRRKLDELRQEACGLCELFGLPGLPRNLPGQMLQSDLQRASLVRAFLGQPDLLLLEAPVASGDDDLLEPLVQATRRARVGGAAVLITTADAGIWMHEPLRATARARMVGTQLLLIPA